MLKAVETITCYDSYLTLLVQKVERSWNNVTDDPFSTKGKLQRKTSRLMDESKFSFV